MTVPTTQDPAAPTTPETPATPAGGTPATPAEGGTPPSDAGTPPAGDAGKSLLDAQSGPPESYEWNFGEGVEAPFSDVVLEAYGEQARELGLTQEQAQNMLSKLAPKVQEAQQAQIAAVNEQWTKETKSDPEIGGVHLQESLSLARTALKGLGTEKLVSLLNDTGLGNNREVIALLAKAGRLLSQDNRPVMGAPATPATHSAAGGNMQSLAGKLYPTK